MAGRSSSNGTEVLATKLDAILSTLQSLVIIEAAKGGMSKAEVRKMLGVADSTVSQIWKHLRKLQAE